MTRTKTLPPNVSLHKPSGLYYGRKRVKRKDGSPARIYTSYLRTPAEAADALEKAVRQATSLNPKRPSIENFLEEWFENIKPTSDEPEGRQVRERTYRSRLANLTTLLPPSLAKGKYANLPAFADLRSKAVKDFDAADMRSYLARLAAAGVPSRAQQLAYESLRAAWKYAIEFDYVEPAQSPFIRVKRPSHKAEPMVELSDAELVRLVNAIYDTPKLRSRTLLLLLITTGLRIGEACALRWENLNLDATEPHITVRHQLSDAGKLAPLKTDESRRKVHILPRLRDALLALKASAKTEWVFETAKTARPIDRNNARSEIFVPLLERAKLKDSGLTLHDLRGIAATLAVENGMDQSTFIRMFGWANMATAMKHYVRASDRMRKAGQRIMVNAFERFETTATTTPGKETASGRVGVEMGA
jgi:integrase